jgi:hypothetical protein
MPYTTPSLLLVGAAQNLIQNLDVTIRKCVDSNDPQTGESDEQELW